jgi:hypothetical protein
VTQWVAEGRSRTGYKFGAGGHLFLSRRSEGSAEVGFRALSKPYDQIGHERFVAGAGACDLYACELHPEHRACFAEVLPRQAIDLPAEFLYAAVASRWVFRHFAGSIGLIGADRKLALIQQLLHRPDYRRYLGVDRFEDYITVPQRIACDDLDAVERSVARQLEHSTSKLFLVGVGHNKSGLLHHLPSYTQAVFLDAGQGIDTIAGLIDTEKPYFGNWTNHTIDEPSLYADLDVLSYVPYSPRLSTRQSPPRSRVWAFDESDQRSPRWERWYEKSWLVPPPVEQPTPQRRHLTGAEQTRRKVWFDMEPTGKPSRWNTLRTLRVQRWHEQATNP